jgi:titin
LTGYRLLASSDHGARDILLGNVTSYLDQGLVYGTAYEYRIKAINQIGESEASASVNVTTEEAPVSLYVPPAPTGLRAGPIQSDSVHITWDAPSLNGSTPPIIGYRIFRGASPTTMVAIATLGNVTEFHEEGLAEGTAYYYSVAAVNSIGPGLSCAAIGATTLANESPTGASDTTMVIIVAAVAVIAVAAAVLYVRSRKR